jgi:hypothetical protein
MIVHEIQVELANFPDNKVGFSRSGYKVVDRGFVGKSSTWLIGFSSFRSGVLWDLLEEVLEALRY